MQVKCEGPQGMHAVSGGPYPASFSSLAYYMSSESPLHRQDIAPFTNGNTFFLNTS